MDKDSRFENLAKPQDFYGVPDGQSKQTFVDLDEVYKKSPRAKISDRILKSAESYIARAPRVTEPDVYRAPVRTMHDTIEETVFFNDRYYPDTSDFVDEITLSQYDLELTEPKEYSGTIKTNSGLRVPDSEFLREDIRKELRQLFSDFSGISENPDTSSYDPKFQSMNLETENKHVKDIRKSNPEFVTSTPISYGDKSSFSNQNKMPKTPARVHFDSTSADSRQSRRDIHSRESSRDTLDRRFSQPGTQRHSVSTLNTKPSLHASQLNKSSRINENFETPRRMSNNQTRGITPTRLIPQAMAQELPPREHFVNSHRLSRKEKEPQIYDGTTDLEIYLQHFEWVARYNNWTSAEKAQQLAISLKGEAQQVFRDLDPWEIREFNDIKQVLLQRFNPPGREAAYRCQFKNRKRIETESISEFGYALKHLSAKAYPQLDRVARETYVIDQFICGLNHTEIKKHVQFRHPRSVDEAITLAIEYEAFEGPKTILRKPLSEEKSVHVISETPQTSENSGKDLASIISEEMAKLMSTLTSEIRSIKSERWFKCKYCQRRDHPHWKCPNKPNFNRDQNNVPTTSNNVNSNSGK